MSCIHPLPPGGPATRLRTIAAVALFTVTACADAPTSPEAASPDAARGVSRAASIPAETQSSVLSVTIDGPQFIHAAGSYQWDAVASGGDGNYSYTWTLERLHTQPTYWGAADDVRMYVDSNESPYLWWTVTVTSGSQTAYAEVYVCNFTASAMC